MDSKRKGELQNLVVRSSPRKVILSHGNGLSFKTWVLLSLFIFFVAAVYELFSYSIFYDSPSLIELSPQLNMTTFTRKILHELVEVQKQQVEQVRFKLKKRYGPIIALDMFMSEEEGRSINGPSLIKVPNWIENRLGNYYLYFSHHHGQYIRLAFADTITGNWTLSTLKILWIKDDPKYDWEWGHIASPDAHVDHQKRRIMLYFHSHAKEDKIQTTRLAFSHDGVNFDLASESPNTPFYFRVLPHQNFLVALAKRDYHENGNVWKNSTGVLFQGASVSGPFIEVSEILQNYRHGSWFKRDDQIFVVYTRIGDSPEHIRIARISKSWEILNTYSLLKPEKIFECNDLPITESRPGNTGPTRALRDPFIYRDPSTDDVYLFYSFCGEKGIAVASLDSYIHREYKLSSEAFSKHVIPYCDLIQLSPKNSAPCHQETWDTNLNELLITGMGRSGTKFMSQCLNDAGLKFTHDNYFVDDANDGSVSWPTLFKNHLKGIPKEDRWTLTLGDHLFSKIGLQTRDPLHSISSRATKLEVVLLTNDVVFWETKSPSDLELAMIHYILWNSFASLVADFHFRIEDIDGNGEKLKSILESGTGLDLEGKDFSVCDHISLTTHTDLVGYHEKLSWEIMAKENMFLTRMVCTLALKFGYSCKFLALESFPCWVRQDLRWTCKGV